MVAIRWGVQDEGEFNEKASAWVRAVKSVALDADTAGKLAELDVDKATYMRALQVLASLEQDRAAENVVRQVEKR